MVDEPETRCLARCDRRIVEASPSARGRIGGRRDIAGGRYHTAVVGMLVVQKLSGSGSTPASPGDHTEPVLR
jgi:hypothetical protein